MHLRKNAFLFILLFLSFCQLYSQDYLFDAKLLTTEDGLANLMTTAVVKDKDGFLWVATEYGLNRFDGYQFKLYNKEKNGLYSDKFIQDIKVDVAGNLWLYYENHVQQNLQHGNGFNAIDIFNPKTGKAIPFELFFKDDLPFDLVDTHLTHLIDSKKRIWMPTRKGELFLYEEGRFQKIFEQEGIFFEYITVDEEDNIWLGYDKYLTSINSVFYECLFPLYSL